MVGCIYHDKVHARSFHAKGQIELCDTLEGFGRCYIYIYIYIYNILNLKFSEFFLYDTYNYNNEVKIGKNQF